MIVDNQISICYAAQRIWPHREKRFIRGSILYWQGDPIDHLYVVLEGAVKVSCVSPEGQIHSFGILGAGRLLGARSYLLGGVHESVAEVLEPSSILVVPSREFDAALAKNPEFSVDVMRELAREADDASNQARDLSFLHVQERLKHSLINLAKEHGISTAKGVKIDLNITQDEIGALVAANRTTIAACLNELRAQGFLWKEGRRLVIMPPEHIEILDAITRAVVEGDDLRTEELARKAITMGIEGPKVLEALTLGMKDIDRSYGREDIDLPEVVLAATAMKRALPIVESSMKPGKRMEAAVGSVVIGTVFGDIHDIGKNIVSTLLLARGFDVIDLGVNVTPGEFAGAVRRFSPNILALSASTTTTIQEITTTMTRLIKDELRNRLKVMVGGNAVTNRYAMDIGADGYHATARGAVELAWSLISGARS